MVYRDLGKNRRQRSVLGYAAFPLRKRVVTINASPLGMGLLTGRAPGWHPAPPEIKEACQMSIQFTTNNPNIATTLVGTANPGEYGEKMSAA